MVKLWTKVSERLGRIRCLSRPMRKLIVEHARQHLSPEQQRRYLNECLTVVERWIAPVTDERFVALCLQLRDASTLPDVLTALGVGEPTDNLFWLRAANDCRFDWSRSLCCLAIHFSLPNLTMHEDAKLRSMGLQLLAAALESAGRDTDVVSLLMWHLDLRGEHFGDRGDLAAHLAERLCPLEANDAACLLGMLADALQFSERQADAVLLLESHLGLCEEDFADRDRLGEMIAERLRPLEADSAVMLLNILLRALDFVGRAADAVSLLDGYLGLREEHLANRDALAAHLTERLRPLQADNAVAVLQGLGQTLSSVGRFEDAVVILGGYLGLREEHFADRDLLAAHLAERLRLLTVNSAVALLGTQAHILEFTRRATDAVLLLEGYLGLREEHFTDRVALVALLTERLRPANVNNAVILLHTLAFTLQSVGRTADAVLLLEGYLDLREEHFSSRDRLASHLAGRLRPLLADSAVNLMRALSKTVQSLGRTADAVSLLGGYLGLREEHFANRDALAAHLAERLRPLRANNAVGLVQDLAVALLFAGRREDADELLDVYCGDFAFLDRKDDHGFAPVNGGGLVLCWLRHHGGRDCERARDVCRRLVPYLRRGIERSGVRPEDRLRFVENITPLRHLVGQLGNSWAIRESDRQAAEQLRLDALLWDAELAQRTVLERCLLTQFAFLGNGGANLTDIQPGWRPRSDAGGLATPSNTGFLGCFDRLDRDSTQSQPEPSGELTQLPTIGAADAVRRWLGQGVTAADIAATLGPRTRLLRASFDVTDRLVWTLFAADGTDLVVRASDGGEPGDGQSSDRERMRQAVGAHDASLEQIWNSARSRSEMTEPKSEIDGALTRKEWSLARETLRYLIDELRNSSHSDLAARLQDDFAHWRDAPASPSDDWLQEQRQLWKTFWATQDNQFENSVRRELNLATTTLIDAIADIWPLDTLRAHLDQSIDLVVQVDDVLHAIPVAYLRVGKQHLCQCVASVRVMFSVMLTDWLRQGERPAGPTADPTLTLSWFAEKDPARPGAHLLHELQHNLANSREQKYPSYHIDDTPREGSLRNLSAAIRHLGPLRAAIVCGHGHLDSGVRLHDGDWRGAYCDLSPVEFVLLVSCSIGRARQDQGQDPEGFCLELMMHGGRSVLAGRWQLHAQEAPVFATRVLERFLEMRAGLPAGASVSEACLRARALNAVRREFLEKGTVGLNTAAAFELYGLG